MPRIPFLTYQLWRAVRKPYNGNMLYRRAQGEDTATIPYILEAGAVWTLLISRQLGREHERNAHDLLAVTPEGAIGLSIITSAAVMHKLVEATQYIGLTIWIMRFVVIGGWLGTTVELTSNVDGFIVLWIATAIPITALWLLHIYDIALAVVIGTLIPAATQNRDLMPAFGFILHLFLLVLPVVVIFTGHITAQSITSDVTTFLVLSALNLAVFAGICELIVRGLWWGLLKTLDVPAPDAARILDRNDD